MAMEANPQLNLLDGLSSPMVSLDEQVRTEVVTALAATFVKIVVAFSILLSL